MIICTREYELSTNSSNPRDSCQHWLTDALFSASGFPNALILQFLRCWDGWGYKVPLSKAWRSGANSVGGDWRDALYCDIFEDLEWNYRPADSSTVSSSGSTLDEYWLIAIFTFSAQLVSPQGRRRFFAVSCALLNNRNNSSHPFFSCNVLAARESFFDLWQTAQPVDQQLPHPFSIWTSKATHLRYMQTILVSQICNRVCRSVVLLHIELRNSVASRINRTVYTAVITIPYGIILYSEP